MSYLVKNEVELGNLIKTLRKKKGWTQKDLGEITNYTATHILKIENGTRPISTELADKLSNIFNVDIHQYTKIATTFKSVEVYEDYTKLRRLAELGDCEKMKLLSDKIVDTYDNLNIEMLQLICHTKALYSGYVNKDYLKSNEYCFDSLALFDFCDYITSLESGILTELSYSALFLLAHNYTVIGEIELAYQLTTALYKHFNEFIFSKTIPVKSDMYHMKKFYIVAVNNMAHQQFLINKFDETHELVEFAIELSNKFSIHMYMNYLLVLKLKNYYMLGDIRNSKITLNQLKVICDISMKSEYYISILDELKTNYNLLFQDG